MAVHAFPIANPRSQQVGLFYIADRLAMRESTVGTIVRRVRQLMATHNFPPPLGYRQWRGELVQGAIAVTMRSFWLKDAVDAFFDGHGTTPPIAETLERQALAAHASALDRNAAGLAA